MKKHILLGLSLLAAANLFAQDRSLNEAILFSQENVSGTARYRAMGGAFGALGGDFSALSTNPAGATVFANNQLGVTLANTSKKNINSYLGNSFDSATNNLRVGQLGGVFVFKDTTQTNNWKKLAIGMSYDSSNRFNNDILAFGNNPNTSVGKYFASVANGYMYSPNSRTKGIEFNDISTYESNTDLTQQYEKLSYFNDFSQAQLALLGYEAYIISPAPNTSNQYVSNTSATASDNLYQEISVISSGESGKISAHVAVEYQDILSLGMSLNNHFTRSDRQVNFIESNTNTTTPGFNYMNFETFISTIGSGFSFNLGALVKISDLRLGAAFESSTWYTFTDEYYYAIEYDATTWDTSTAISGIQDPELKRTKPSYKIQTPNKTTISAAYIFGKRALISFDFGIKNYSKIQYKPSNESEYRSINNEIESNLTLAKDIRLGAEYRIKRLSLRGGANYKETPYKVNAQMGNYYQASIGAGYNFGKVTVDLTYSKSHQSYSSQTFDQGLTNKYQTVSRIDNMVATVLFEL